MKKLVQTLLGLSLICCLISPANATFIDFTSDTWKDVVGDTYSRVIDGITVELSTGTTDKLTWNPEQTGVSLPNGLAGAGDGIGIGEGNDEIAMDEILTISFSSYFVVETIYLLDLFQNETNDGRPVGERGQYSFDIDSNGGDWNEVGGGSDTLNPWGYFEIQTENTDTHSWIKFSSAYAGWDFSVAGLEITTTPNPEPTTMLLFGLGLLCFAGISRRII